MSEIYGIFRVKYKPTYELLWYKSQMPLNLVKQAYQRTHDKQYASPEASSICTWMFQLGFESVEITWCDVFRFTLSK